MNFCSACGQPVALQQLTTDSRPRYVCAACQTIHYENPRVVVGCFAHWQDRVVFCRRAEEPGAGLWMIPSGYLEHGETLQAGAVRETLEEAGLRIDPARLDLYAVWSLPPLGQVGVSFRVELSEPPSLRAGSECNAVALWSVDEVPFDYLAWGSTAIGAIRLFFEQLARHDFGIHLRELGADGTAASGRRAYRIAESRVERP